MTDFEKAVFENIMRRVLAGELPYRAVVYHEGDLAREGKRIKEVAALAKRMRLLSDARFDVVSRCGHIRGEEKGTGKVHLMHDRHFDRRTVYEAVRR